MSRSQPLFDLVPIQDFLGQGNPLILTPNRRLATQLSAAIDEHHSNNNKAAWQSPKIYPVEEWISKSWEKLAFAGDKDALGTTLLNPSQEVLLWEQIVAKDSEAPLLKIQATAKAAASAYSRLQLWEAQVGPAFQDHPDCARFARWTGKFEQLCQNRSYLTTAQISGRLTRAFDDNRLEKFEQVLPVGFQQMPPAHSRLIKACSKQVLHTKSKHSTDNISAIACENADQEIKAAARWVKQQLEEKPKQRIAVLIPDLKQRRNQVERIFAAELEPQYIFPGTVRYQLPFNISAGISLGDTPIISSALALLGQIFKPGSAESNDWLKLIRSPFLFDQAEFQPSLCELESRIRRSGFPELDGAGLRNILLKMPDREDAVENWNAALDQVQSTHNEEQQALAPLDHWLALFEAQLALFRWPGSRRLDSVEYQQLKRWQSALREFLSIADICGEQSAEKAFSLLQRFIGSIEFQAESSQSPVQILGLLEGGGLCFDATWMTGLNSHLWPPSPAPNPLLPLSLQRACDMPHASAERELAFAREVFNDLLKNTGQFVASYAKQEQDQPLLPSLFIQDFPQKQENLAASSGYSHPAYQPLYESGELDSFADNKASKISDIESIKGGTQILKNQAACPFRAYAIHRLDAKPLDEFQHHISAQIRGIMLHRSLELLWRALKDHATLQQSNASDLETLIKRSVTSAVLTEAKLRPDLFGQNLIELEINRLQTLVGKWLQLEQLREPFKVIAKEEKVCIKVAGIPLTVRIDRIDQLDDNSLMLIDYKSGSCSLRQWQGERPGEPQLPLYSVFLETDNWAGDVKALAFAQINVDKQGFVGIANRDGIAPRVNTPQDTRYWDMPEDWEDLHQQWMTSLENLMQDFISGNAQVDPKSPATCQYCHLASLCRINDPRSLSAPNNVAEETP